MVIVIDAYNVLKADFGNAFIQPHVTERFIDDLWAYSKRKHHTLLVVFDGGPDVRASRRVKDYLQVIYAGRSRSADDAIKELLEILNPADTLLVTSDRMLRTYAWRYSINSIEPSLFRRYSKSSNVVEKPRVIKDKKAPVKRTNHESSVELDELMQKAAQVTFIKEEDVALPETEALEKTSKKERKLSYLISKL